MLFYPGIMTCREIIEGEKRGSIIQHRSEFYLLIAPYAGIGSPAIHILIPESRKNLALEKR